MTRLRYAILFCVTTLMSVSVLSPAMAQDKQPLPRVLVFGDSIYSNHARGLATELKGQAQIVNVVWDRAKCPNSTTAIEDFDRMLGYLDKNGRPLEIDKRPKWDLIHFNVGLGDLIYRAPNMESFRVMPIHVGGVRATSAKQYEANLNELAKRLKSTGAKIVWASTTPIRHSTSNVFEKGSEVEYNAIAKRVMDKHGFPINDMYSFVKELINMDKPAGHGADPFNFDKKPIHGPMLAVIARELKLKIKVEPKEQAAKAD